MCLRRGVMEITQLVWVQGVLNGFGLLVLLQGVQLNISLLRTFFLINAELGPHKKRYLTPRHLPIIHLPPALGASQSLPRLSSPINQTPTSVHILPNPRPRPGFLTKNNTPLPDPKTYTAISRPPEHPETASG